MSQITWADKVTLDAQPDIARINKVIDDDMNEIKSAHNDTDNKLTNLNTYSTDEQVIGTWIDNKPLYRKVYTGQTVSGGAFTNVDENFSYYKGIIDIKGTVANTANGTKYPLTGHNGSNADFTMPYVEATGLKLFSNNTNKVFDYIIIVEYTKTT